MLLRCTSSSPPWGITLILGLFLAFIVMLAACGSGSDAPDGDGDLDIPDGDTEIPPDGDDTDGDREDEDIPPTCFETGCDEGFYCDEYDGLCKGCTEDLHCGHPDPISGIVPVCRDGRCLEVACGNFLTLSSPPNGAKLGVLPQNSTVGEDGVFRVGSSGVFPVGVSGLNPEYFDQLLAAGGNVAVSSRGCCTDPADVDYQLNTFLTRAERTDLFAIVQTVAPLASYPDQDPLILMRSILNRGNKIALAAWLAGDQATRDDTFAEALAVHDEITGVVESKVIGFGDSWDANLSGYGDKGRFFLISLNPDSTSPGVDLARLARKSLWARVGAASPDHLVQALHAIAYGAKGVVFDLDAEDARTLPGVWTQLAKSLRYLRDRTVLWLAPRETSAVRAQDLAAEVAMTVIHHESKVRFVFLVNAATEARSVNLTITPTNLPFCVGVEGDDQVLHITRDPNLTVTLAPRSFKVVQITEALPPGEDGGGR